MEYPNLPERKLIDIPANSRASRGTCKFITTHWSETKPSKLAKSSQIVFCKRRSSSLQVFLNVITGNSEASQVIQSKETEIWCPWNEIDFVDSNLCIEENILV